MSYYGNKITVFNPTVVLLESRYIAVFTTAKLELINQSQNAGEKSIVWDGLDSQKNKIGSVFSTT